MKPLDGVVTADGCLVGGGLSFFLERVTPGLDVSDALHGCGQGRYVCEFVIGKNPEIPGFLALPFFSWFPVAVLVRFGDYGRGAECKDEYKCVDDECGWL